MRQNGHLYASHFQTFQMDVGTGHHKGENTVSGRFDVGVYKDWFFARIRPVIDAFAGCSALGEICYVSPDVVFKCDLGFGHDVVSTTDVDGIACDDRRLGSLNRQKGRRDGARIGIDTVRGNVIDVGKGL